MVNTHNTKRGGEEKKGVNKDGRGVRFERFYCQCRDTGFKVVSHLHLCVTLRNKSAPTEHKWLQSSVHILYVFGVNAACR